MKLVLLIEDNREVSENTAEILELAGYRVISAADGKAGVDLAVKNKPDIILCDIMMPELNGYGVLHMLSKNKDTASIPFIFLTAKTEKSDFRKGMEMGADDYITKPFDDVELLKAIEVRLKKAELLRPFFPADADTINNFINTASTSANIPLTSDEREITSYKKKQTIYKEGKRPAAIYFIISGKVKTCKVNDAGKELITGIYTAGDFIGYTILLEERVYSDTAEVMEDAEVMIIPKPDFLNLINSDWQVSKMFIRLLAKNVLENEERLLTIAYQSLRKKVATALIQVFDKFKTAPDDNPEIDIPRNDLAHITGIATESLVRTLSDFKTEKLIEIKEGRIIILQVKKLRELLY